MSLEKARAQMMQEAGALCMSLLDTCAAVKANPAVASLALSMAHAALIRGLEEEVPNEREHLLEEAIRSLRGFAEVMS
jgi:hypothetical protein